MLNVKRQSLILLISVEVRTDQGRTDITLIGDNVTGAATVDTSSTIIQSSDIPVQG